jgi:hypothetical protein
MNLNDLTEAEFLCDGTLSREPEAFVSMPILAAAILAATNRSDFSEFQLLQHCGELRIIKLSKLGCGLVDRDNQLVGAYFDEVLVIDKPARGKGLSVPLILHAIRDLSPPAGRTLSKAGEAALRKAWRVANGLEHSGWWPPA